MSRLRRASGNDLFNTGWAVRVQVRQQDGLDQVRTRIAGERPVLHGRNANIADRRLAFGDGKLDPNDRLGWTNKLEGQDIAPRHEPLLLQAHSSFGRVGLDPEPSI